MEHLKHPIYNNIYKLGTSRGGIRPFRFKEKSASTYMRRRGIFPQLVFLLLWDILVPVQSLNSLEAVIWLQLFLDTANISSIYSSTRCANWRLSIFENTDSSVTLWTPVTLLIFYNCISKALFLLYKSKLNSLVLPREKIYGCF